MDAGFREKAQITRRHDLAENIEKEIPKMPDRPIVSTLMAVIADRKANPPEKSYVSSLLKGGLAKIGPKITEEAGEVIEAASEEGEAGRGHLVYEIADLLFHTLVLMGDREIGWEEIESELARRFGVSGIDEKAAREPCG